MGNFAAKEMKTRLIRYEHFDLNLLDLLLGSRGPSTVTLIAFGQVATRGGDVLNVIVSVKLLPERE